MHVFSFVFVMFFSASGYCVDHRYKMIDLELHGGYEKIGYDYQVWAIGEDNSIYGCYHGFSNFGDSEGGVYGINAFRWDQINGFTYLGMVSNIPIPYIYNMNNQGEVVGEYTRNANDRPWSRYDLFYWNPSDGMIKIFDQKYTFAKILSNINKKGEFVVLQGDFRPSGGLMNEHLYLWQKDSGLQEIPISELIRNDIERRYGFDLRLTDESEIIGVLGYPLEDQSVRWSREKDFTIIAPPQGYDKFVPKKVSPEGEIFGYAGHGSGTNKHFLVDKNRNYIPLVENPLLYSLIGINFFSGDILYIGDNGFPYLSNINNLTNKIMLPTYGIGEVGAPDVISDTPYMIRMNEKGFIGGTCFGRSSCLGGRYRITIWTPITSEDYSQMMRGDVNSDDSINITDAIAILNHLFRGKCLPCPDTGDVNDDGVLNLTDAVYLLHYLFSGGSTPIGDPLSCNSE